MEGDYNLTPDANAGLSKYYGNENKKGTDTANVTQGTFNLEAINKRNEDRLKQLMALGLNTVNEEDESY